MKQAKKDEHRGVHLGMNSSLILSALIGAFILKIIGNHVEIVMSLNLYCSMLLVIDKMFNKK